MPVTVTCPACSSTFTVKDEYAGKRGKCPNCAEPVTIPATAAPPAPAAPPVSAPVLARPVVAARVPPKPADDSPVPTARKRGTSDDDEDAPKKKSRRWEDDEDDKPASKRRKGGDEDEGEQPKKASKSSAEDEDEDDKPKRRKGAEDEQPVSPKRKRGASAEDEADTPKRKRGGDDDEPKGGRRRRRDDDDEPKKKSKALPIIMGILGGVLLLCGGGCAGGWFGFLKPGLDYRREQAEKDRREDSHGKLTPENVARVQAGMTLTQVEDVLGKGYPADTPSVAGVLFRHPQRDRVRPAWDARTSAGRVYFWTHPFDKVLVAFTADPMAGGTVEGVTYLVGSGVVPIDTITLPGTGGGPPPVDDKPVTLTADQLSDRAVELKDRTVIVSGKVQFASTVTEGGTISLVRAPGKKSVVAAFPSAKWNAEPAGKKVQAGDGVTIKGVVGVDPTGVRVLVKECDLLAHTPEVVKPEDRTPVATLSTEELTINFAQMKGKWITLKGQYKDAIPGGQGVSLVAPRSKAVAVLPPDGKVFGWATPPKADEAVEFVGRVGGSENLIQVTDAILMSRAAPQDKPAAATAEDLAAEFAKNADTAAKKYTDKTITVTGTVEKVLTSGSRITLKGVAADGAKKAYVVDVGMNFELREVVKKLKAGDAVKLTGKFTTFRPATGTTTPNSVLLSGGVIEK